MPLANVNPLASTRPTARVGCVSFLNSKPLIYGLEALKSLELTLEVPARLLGGLVENRFDVALLPVIDYQRLAGLTIVPVGGIACDGPTLTVRIFSRVPLREITTLACDTDSHTSVALARVVLGEMFGICPRIVDFDFHAARSAIPAADGAQLLIGDKVVCEEPRDMSHQLDLGHAWKQLTGMPFVFAAWTARQGADLGNLPALLETAKRQGLEHVEEIIARWAIPRGWPRDVARKYLTQYLQFDITPTHLEAIRRFHRLAHKHGAFDHPPYDLTVG